MLAGPGSPSHKHQAQSISRRSRHSRRGARHRAARREAGAAHATAGARSERLLGRHGTAEQQRGGNHARKRRLLDPVGRLLILGRGLGHHAHGTARSGRGPQDLRLPGELERHLGVLLTELFKWGCRRRGEVREKAPAARDNCADRGRVGASSVAPARRPAIAPRPRAAPPLVGARGGGPWSWGPSRQALVHGTRQVQAS
jgi:hypothetical protein